MGDIKFIEKKDDITGEKELVIDKRTLPKSFPPNVKDLKYARNLPAECNVCPYRSMESGGNGICNKYEENATCIIRKDIAKLVDKCGGRTLELMEAEFNNNFEKLLFFESMEDKKGELNPEVTKRMNSMTNLGKVINEIKTKRETVEITQTESLSDNQKHEIAKTVKLSRELLDES